MRTVSNTQGRNKEVVGKERNAKNFRQPFMPNVMKIKYNKLFYIAVMFDLINVLLM